MAMTRKRRRLYFVVLGRLGLGAGTALVLSAFQDNIVFFFSPTEVASRHPGPSQLIRIGGLVETGSVRKSGDQVTFSVTDNAQSRQSALRRPAARPVPRRPGGGRRRPSRRDGVFVASEVLAKHDENYMPREVVDALKKSGHWQEGAGAPGGKQAAASPTAQTAGRLKSQTPGYPLMFTELGHFALALAMIVALVQATVPLIGAQRNNAAWMAVARPAALLQLALVLFAFAALVHAFIVSDFSVMGVYRNSHTAVPLLYKITGVWGNHEGSLVLWISILAIYGAAVAAFGRNLPPALRARALAVQGMISVGFIAFILFTSNPFLRVFPAPADGHGLNPQLQDPGFVMHPPMLYMGYVGFSMAFSFAVAALIEGRVDAAWARWVRPWTLAAWTFLTLGIGLGSWWSYTILGWGGWWAWDPVENASFIPWLTGTALLHSAIVVEKREALKSWTILLAIVAFSLSLLGTFLVRSGLLTSVHSFAADPTRGIFILTLLALTIGGSLTLYAIRAPALDGGGAFAPISREGGLLINNLLLTTAAATVLLGTLYPLAVEVISGSRISVGRPYFDAVFVPLMAPLVALIAIGPLLAWKRADLGAALGRLKIAAAIAVFGAAATLVIAGVEPDGHRRGLGLHAGAVARRCDAVTEWAARVRLGRSGAWARIVNLPRSAHGMSVAHFGMAVLIAGVSASSAWKQEAIQTMTPGQSAEIAGYTMTFKGAEPIQGPNYTAAQATIVASKGGREIAVMHPEQRRLSAAAADHLHRHPHHVLRRSLCRPGRCRWGRGRLRHALLLSAAAAVPVVRRAADGLRRPGVSDRPPAADRRAAARARVNVGAPAAGGGGMI